MSHETLSKKTSYTTVSPLKFLLKPDSLLFGETVAKN